MKAVFRLIFAAALIAAPAWSQPKAKPKPPAAAPAKPPPSSSWSFSFKSGKGRLGANATDMTEELRDHFGAPKDAGVLVQRVEAGTPAAKAGLKVGDVITRVGGEPIDSPSDVTRALSDKKAGDAVPVTVVRARRTLLLQAKLDSDPSGDGDLDFDFSFDGFGELFKGMGPGPGASKQFFKQWQWKWPPGDGKDPATDPARIEKRMKELERRFQEMQKQPPKAKPTPAPKTKA